MMFELKKLLTAMMLPPFNVLILWLLSLFFSLFKYKVFSRLCAFLGIAILYVVSIPYTAQTLKDSLITEDHLTLNDYRQAQAIVLLGGGVRDSKELYAPLASSAVQLERLRYAAYLQKETQLPLLISGVSPIGASEAKASMQELKDFFNVPTQWLEEKSLTTKENALFTRQILEKEGINKIILVTNEWHMQRAKLLFEGQGFQVLPASVGEGVTPTEYKLNMMHFIPQAGAMAKNMQLLKEWLGYLKEK